MKTRQLLAVAATLTIACAPAWSQGQQPSVASMAAMQKFRDQHKYTFQLQTMATMGIMDCERSKTTAIKADQAKKLLAVLTPLKSKTSLSQDQAKSAIKGIQRSLDQRQLGVMDKAIMTGQRRSPGSGGMRPPGAGGSGAPRSGQRPPGQGASRPRFDPAKMKNFNPFNPAKTSPRYKEQADRNNKLFAFLKSRAAGKSATLNLRPPGPPPPAKK